MLHISIIILTTIWIFYINEVWTYAIYAKSSILPTLMELPQKGFVEMLRTPCYPPTPLKKSFSCLVYCQIYKFLSHHVLSWLTLDINVPKGSEMGEPIFNTLSGDSSLQEPERWAKPFTPTAGETGHL